MVMTIALLKLPAAPRSRLRPILDWLRHAKVALAHPAPDVDRLSERLLADINAEPPDIARAFDQEISRMSLLGLGWQPPQRPRNR
jgi:hypothetical protein